jgi:hypothetical protein
MVFTVVERRTSALTACASGVRHVRIPRSRQ